MPNKARNNTSPSPSILTKKQPNHINNAPKANIVEPNLGIVGRRESGNGAVASSEGASTLNGEGELDPLPGGSFRSPPRKKPGGASSESEASIERDISHVGSPRPVTGSPAAWGGNWASRVTETAADSSPLNSIAEMFPSVSREVIGAVLGMHRYNVSETIEYFLTQTVCLEEKLFITTAGQRISPGQTNLLCSLPQDAFFKICDFLDWCYLPILSRVSKECRKLTVRSDVEQLICTRFRTWKDWRILGLIGACRNLTSLSLRKCSQFTSFENLPSVVSPFLTSLNLAECTFTTRDLQHIVSFLDQLTSLDLSNGPVSDDGLEPIWTRGKHIQRLVLMACKSLTCAAVGILVTRMPQLRELDLRNTAITNASAIFQSEKHLEFLNCSQCSRLTTLVIHGSFNQLTISAMPHLVSLTLHGSVGVLNASSCRNLQHLIVHEASSLRELNLSGCTLLKDIVLKRSEQRPWELENLNLFQCRSLSPENLHRIFGLVGPSLQILNGGGLIQLDDDVLDFIVSCCVRLVWLELPVPKRNLSRGSVQIAQEVVEARNKAAREDGDASSPACFSSPSSIHSSPVFTSSSASTSTFSTLTPSRISSAASRNSMTPLRNASRTSSSNNIAIGTTASISTSTVSSSIESSSSSAGSSFDPLYSSTSVSRSASWNHPSTTAHVAPVFASFQRTPLDVSPLNPSDVPAAGLSSPSLGISIPTHLSSPILETRSSLPIPQADGRAQTPPALSEVDSGASSPPPSSSSSSNEEKTSDKSSTKAPSAWAKKTLERRVRRLQKKLCFDRQQNPGFAKSTKKSRTGVVFLKIPPARQHPVSGVFAFSHSYV